MGYSGAKTKVLISFHIDFKSQKKKQLKKPKNLSQKLDHVKWGVAKWWILHTVGCSLSLVKFICDFDLQFKMNLIMNNKISKIWHMQYT